MQTRRGSLIETFANIGVGLMVSFVVNATLFPAMGFNISHSQNITLTLIYTIISIIRSYLLRRTFNRISMRYGI